MTEAIVRENQHLQNENEQLRRFLDIQRQFGSQRDLDGLLPLIISRISAFLDAERCSLFLVDWEQMSLWTRYAEHLEVDHIRIELKMGLVGYSVLTREMLNIANAYEDPRFNPDTDAATGWRTESMLVGPLVDAAGKICGAMQLINKIGGVFTRQDEKTLRAALSGPEAVQGRKDRKLAAALIRRLMEQTKCERGSFFIVDTEKGQLVSLFSEGLEDTNIRLNLRLGVAGVVAVTGQGLNIPEAYADPRFDRTTDERTGYRTRCLLALPIRDRRGEILGVVEAVNKRDRTFGEEDEKILASMCSLFSVSLENVLLFAEMNRQFRSILEVMAATIDAKDPLTAGHSQGVARYAVAIARELGFDRRNRDLLNVAALLHDYGKIGVDDQVLKKKGRLNEVEYAHVQEHVAMTRRILGKMCFARRYRQVPQVAAAHHEVLDGSGYDAGLTGDQIPFLSKILTVADVFEALTADRHYRAAMTPETAFAILEEGAGIKYDPGVVAALRRCWERGDVGR